MKSLIALAIIAVPLFSFGQNYSTFYGSLDVNSNINANVNINKNVNVSGQVRKTITTIDYGALAQANAQQEQNRLKAIQYNDQKAYNQSLEIANNPLKAFDYGLDNNWLCKGKDARNVGFRKFTFYHKIPNTSLFSSLGGYNYINESEDGVITELQITTPMFLPKMDQVSELYKEFWGDTEGFIKHKINETKEREVSEIYKGFIHKQSISKCRIFGLEGFVYTIIFETDYEKIIKDNYYLLTSQGLMYHCGARYKGAKNDVTFEQIEGRRHYLGKLCRRIAATAQIKNVKF